MSGFVHTIHFFNFFYYVWIQTLCSSILGIKNSVIEILIEKVISAIDREDLIITTKALDRVLLWNHYVIPQWHISSYRTLYWDIFDKPKIKPKYSLGTNTWWIDSLKASTIDKRKKSIQ